MDWPLVITMFLRVQLLVLEQIKLVGSDTAYKVSKVVKSDEEEDFILFFVDVDDVPYIPLAKEKPRV